MGYYYPPGYDPYYGLSPPPGRPRASSHGRVEQNVYLPPQPPIYMAPQPSTPPRGRAVDHLAEEIHHLAIETGRSHSRGHDPYYPGGYRPRSPTLAELEAKIAALKAAQASGNTIDKDKRDEIIQKYQNDQDAKKRKDADELKALKDKIAAQEIIDKQKKEDEWKAYELERERRLAEEKVKKQKEKDKADAATRDTLRKAGYSDGQIDRIMAMAKKDKEKAAAAAATTTTTSITIPGHHHHHHHPHAGDIIVAGGSGGARQSVVRAKKSDISPEVLDSYGIGYHVDPNDHKNIFIHIQNDPATLQALHEETKNRKKGKKVMYIEDKKKHRGEGLAIVRKHRSKSRSRSRHRSPERIVIVGR